MISKDNSSILVGYQNSLSAICGDGCEGTIADCDEGELEWIDKSAVYDLPIWEGDKIFFRLMEEDRDYFSLKLVYDLSDELVEVKLDGKDYK